MKDLSSFPDKLIFRLKCKGHRSQGQLRKPER